MHKNVKNMTGKICGRLIVISLTDRGARRDAIWKCRCSCGEVVMVPGKRLRTGETKSCGCLMRETTIKTNRSRVKYSGGTTRELTEYHIWSNMKDRCENPNAEAYKNYGGRGVKVCARWSQSFDAFLHDMGHRPSQKHSIDRINNNGDYYPENCRWATGLEQHDNRRCTVVVTAFGETRALRQWADQTGIPIETLRARITRLGWNPEKALSTPPRKRKIA